MRCTIGSARQSAEALPSRLLLSGDLPSISLADGLLLVTGTDTADVVSLSIDGDDLRVRVGALDERFAFDSVRGAQIRTGPGNDAVNCGDVALSVSIWGGSGDDSLIGGMADDEIRGGHGQDTIHALSGNDTVFGGAGDDRIGLGSGDDVGYALAGNDWGNGRQGQDTLLGGDGDDELNGGEGDDSLCGNTGNDTLGDESGADVLRGGQGDDQFSGVYGGQGDFFYGGPGNDSAVLFKTRPDIPEPHAVDIESVIVGLIQGPC